jgi:hypothetical protein
MPRCPYRPGSGITGWAVRTTTRSTRKPAAALPAGGYLALYDPSDADPGLNDALRKYNESGAGPYRVRRPDQIARHFDGLELVHPGVVRIQQWRLDHTPFGPAKDLSNNMGGVGRKALCPPPPGAIMDLPEIAGGRDQVPGCERAGTMAARMLLGARLRKLRESAGISREDAGYAIRGSESKITRMELGGNCQTDEPSGCLRGL